MIFFSKTVAQTHHACFCALHVAELVVQGHFQVHENVASLYAKDVAGRLFAHKLSVALRFTNVNQSEDEQAHTIFCSADVHFLLS